MNTAIATIGIDYPDAGLIRPVSDEERAAYERDGAAIVRGVIPPEWVDYMRDAVTRLIDESDPSSQNYADDGDPRFFSLTFPWMFHDAFKAWAIHGPLKDVARQVLTDAREIIFFYDQIFAKEPGATKRTPWHQDLPFLPVKGDQQIRIWVPFDTVTADGGAIHYLRGSHKWDKIYHPIGFKNIPIITDTYVNSPYEDMPDFGGRSRASTSATRPPGTPTSRTCSTTRASPVTSPRPTSPSTARSPATCSRGSGPDPAPGAQAPPRGFVPREHVVRRGRGGWVHRVFPP
jgi:hypothetical protein